MAADPSVAVRVCRSYPTVVSRNNSEPVCVTCMRMGS